MVPRKNSSAPPPLGILIANHVSETTLVDRRGSDQCRSRRSATPVSAVFPGPLRCISKGNISVSLQ
jgi:hypothetical protein